MTKRSYFKKYTILFLISVLFLCSWFLVSGKTFISRGDGILQHYPALIYYAKYLRSIFHNLFFNHQLVIPNWDFSIGEGSDILTTLHYYVIGDPFSFFSVCIPTRYMHLYYGFIILLRLYLSGIAFSCLCFQRGQKNQYGILAGSMSYVFCYWVLYNITIYPYFLNPLLFLPMLLIGVEKILKKERSYFFIISVFLSALCNFYFFYMLAIITMIYVMVRVLFSYHHSLRLAACHIFKISFASVLGVLMASFIFFPVFYTFLNDARFSANTAVQLFYPLSYYSSLPARFLTSDPSKWMLMGFAAPILPATILLFYKKEEHKILKLFFIICAFIIVFPFFGHALNGFSYVTNRWSWAFALLCSYILSALWNSLMELKQNESILLSLVVFFYFILCLMLEFSRKSNVFIAIIFVVFFLFLLFPMEKKNVFFYKKQQLALLITFVSILTNIFLVYSSSGDNASSNCMDAQEIKGEYLSIDATAIKQVAENIKKFYRYSSKSDFNNGFKTGLSSTSYYWSLSNPYVAQFMKEAEINEGRVHKYHGYDARIFLEALASVCYYVIPEGKNVPIPYGFVHIDTIDVNNERLQTAISSLKKELHTETLTEMQMSAMNQAYSEKYSVFQNDIPLSLAYTYNHISSEQTWNSLTAVEKQEAMLQTIFLKDYDSLSDFKKSDLNLTSQKINFTIHANDNNVSIYKNAIITTAENSSIDLEFEGLSNSETYVSIHNLSFLETSKYDLYFGDKKIDPYDLYNKELWKSKNYSDRLSIKKELLFQEPLPTTVLNMTASSGINNDLTYCTQAYNWYNDRHDFIVNMGYSDENITKVTITFSNIGTYSFDSIEIICQPMDNYVSQIMELRANVLENVTIGTDSITGDISLDCPKVLCFSIPYSIGWKAKVDGEEIPIYQANTMYIGIPLNAGKHTISLEYATPFLKEGFYISCISILIFILYILLSKRKKGHLFRP